MDRNDAINMVKAGMERHGTNKARKIACGIFYDISGRRGIGCELGQCGHDVLQEILEAFEQIAQVVIDEEV